MLFWFNRQKKLEEFLQRSPMSDEEFMNMVRLPGDLFKKAAKCYRSKLGEMFRVPPEKIYPDDSFSELARLGTSDWDILEIVLFLEQILEVELDDTKVPEWNLKTTVGQWIIDLLVRGS
ncbi:hypothetical protein H6F66_15775 [Trichocoleus sp. FACHB-6]|nr:hypothetical protein [Trichocoleus sp. FACHB-832]MBD2063712.1 hypothetical protein [Trichocoleus sp. FACHB-6]